GVGGLELERRHRDVHSPKADVDVHVAPTERIDRGRGERRVVVDGDRIGDGDDLCSLFRYHGPLPYEAAVSRPTMGPATRSPAVPEALPTSWTAMSNRSVPRISISSLAKRECSESAIVVCRRSPNSAAS